MKKLKFKLKAIWQLIRGRHGFVCSIEENELANLFQGKDYKITITHYGLMGYPFLLIVKSIAESQNDIDMVLEKAKFEAKIEEINSVKD